MTPSVDVISTDISLETADGASASLLFTPAGDGPWPGVLFLSDAGGLRGAVSARAQRLAAHGYVVVAPNVFYRSGEPPFFTLPIDLNDEQIRRRFADMTAPLTPEVIAADADTYLDFLRHQPDVRPGPIAIVGHCFTGAVALRMAAAKGAAIAAVASFHGGGLYTATANSPHLVLPRVTARLYFGHAVDDGSMPAEAIRKFEEALRDWGGDYQSETYPDAHHGWTMRDHPAYHAVQAEHAFERLTALLADTFEVA